MGNGYPHSTIAQILEDIISQLSFEGESHSNIADILLSILNQTSYDKEPYSVLAELFLKLKAKIEGEPFDPYDKETHSVIAEILLSILNETEYTDMPQSRIAELLLELKEELESYTEITVSGSIVSFTTNVSKPLVKLKANVVAMQDLHGYDKPWAGGGGTNKWDEQWELGVISTTTGENLASTTQIRSVNYIPVTPDTTYRLVTGGTSVWCAIEAYKSDKTFSQNLGGIISGNTFTTPSDCGYIRFFCSQTYGATYNHDIAINYPSTVTTYSPYSNICPITGWSGANVTRTGKNLLTMDYLESGSISGRGAFINSPLRLRTSGSVGTMTPIKPSQVYTYSLQGAEGVTNLVFMEANEYSKDRVWLRNRTMNRATGQYTPSADCYYVIFLIRKSDNSTIEVSDVDYLQLEVGSITPIAYAPYNGNTYTIQFGDTYYGGELDVTNGVLRVVKAIVDLGSLNWNTPTNRSTYYGLANIIKVPINAGVLCGAIAEKYHEVPSNSSLTTDGQFAVGTNGYLYFYRVTDTPTGMFVYPLATPFTIQLTPQQIEQLAENNVFADCGEISELKYQNRIITKLFSKG